jgi:hypothetical protein
MPAETNTAPTALGGTNNSPDEPASNRAGQDFAMPRTPRHSRETCPGPRPGSGNPEPAFGPNRGPPTQALENSSEMTRTPEIPPREILFIDPGVSDIETLLGHLRPEVEAILLDPDRPAARQITAAVAGRHGLDAVHVIAHGAAGRVSFAAGDWSAATLEEEAEDLAAIGQALGAGRNLNLWSCQTAAGPAGAAFIAGLARASGADIAAATGLIGAAALGGGWELTAAAQPPLTAAGVARYAGVMATFNVPSLTNADSWRDPSGWGGTVPSQTTPGSLTFVNGIQDTHEQGNIADYIYMPPTLNQATGTGSNTWTISDNNNVTRYQGSLSLVNQGQIFVNTTNNFTTQQAANVTWTLQGTAAGTGVGSQYLENDGAINIIGTDTASFSTIANLGAVGGTLDTLNIIGSGQINLYGNAVLNINSNVGVDSGQTITSSARPAAQPPLWAP